MTAEEFDLELEKTRNYLREDEMEDVYSYHGYNADSDGIALFEESSLQCTFTNAGWYYIAVSHIYFYHVHIYFITSIYF